MPAGGEVQGLPGAPAPIIPRGSIAGRALIAIVSIMAFLAAMTTGVVMLVRGAANDWQTDIGREVTILVRPAQGRDIDADVRAAADLARGAAGIASVQAYSREESLRLVEPWLGAGLSAGDLPVPRLVVVRVDGGATPDLRALAAQLQQKVPQASLDDHRAWIDRMRLMSQSVALAGAVVLALVIFATVISVGSATRGAMAANLPIVEVLHFVGASDAFIANHFLRHFIRLGLEGGAIGGGAAIFLFGVAEVLGNWLSGTAAGEQFTALTGGFSLSVWGYAALAGNILFIAAVTGWMARRTLYRTLREID